MSRRRGGTARRIRYRIRSASHAAGGSARGGCLGVHRASSGIARLRSALAAGVADIRLLGTLQGHSEPHDSHTGQERRQRMVTHVDDEIFSEAAAIALDGIDDAVSELGWRQLPFKLVERVFYC